MRNALNWFDIPAVDFERAVKFYETILDVTLRRAPSGETMNGIFPADRDAGGVAGAVCKGPGYAPSVDGSIVYLNADGQLDAILSRVEAAGGRIMLPKTHIGDPGYIAWLIDSEGNRVGLHASPTT